VPARFFFKLLLESTIEVFFSDPIYGGNRDKAGWKLVGFPGVAAVYTTYVDKHGVPITLAGYIKSEIVKWSRDIRQAGIQPE
jgi:gluconate 2-dehydrogenase gamma chain